MPKSQETATVGPQPPPEGRLVARVGSVFAGRYEIRAVLGRGGSAEVYRAHDRLLKIEVALKIVHPGRDSERALARIRREVEIAREIHSPCLARVFECGESDGSTYLTLELLRGGSLRARLAQDALPIPEVVRIGEAVLQGLAALHARGVVHRDVTPGNILFTEGGAAKLADFGLVRRLGAEETRLTLEAGVLGTLGYLSPEQLLGQEVGPPSDLYGVGVVLFEMLAGKLPNDAASELGLRLASLARAPSIRRQRPDTPRWLGGLVARLLERRPADRLPDAETALSALRSRRAPPQYRKRRRLFGTAAAALLSLAVGMAFRVTEPAPEFSHVVPLGETGIAGMSTAGESLWTIRGVEPAIADGATLARITPGGPRLLAIVLERPPGWSPEEISVLTFLNPSTGEVVREVRLPSGATYFPNDPPRFAFISAKAVDLFAGDGVDEVIVSYRHVPEAPSYAVLYAPGYGQARVVFHARGGQDFQGAVDLDGDGRRELLFAGINNGWNWVNAVAAVRLDPESFKRADLVSAAAPDGMTRLDQGQLLLWYAIAPRGHLEQFPRLAIDEKRRELTLRYLSGKTWTLGFDGFPPGESEVDREIRQTARQATYEHLGEAERLRQAEMLDLALSKAEAAQGSADRAREKWLGEFAERLRARILVAQGKSADAEEIFASLAARAEDAPEVAYDAAVAYHLTGDLDRAIAWYRQGIGRGSAMGAGKSKHEFLKGEVLALVEQKRYPEALAAVARFGATYPTFASHLWVFREYVRWRSGERPVPDLAEVPPDWTDLERYWELEFSLASGGEPRELLTRVERFLEERPETQAEATSLQAEILAKLDRPDEAAEVARSALARVRGERSRSIIARGHLDLVTERAQRLGGELRQVAHPRGRRGMELS